MIRAFDYCRTLPEIEAEVIDALRRVLRSGTLILGPETEAFEEEFARFVGAGCAVGVSSGTTAIQLALLALGVGPGAEVITVSNTCVPTVAAIRATGALPVFVDVDPDTLMMDAAAVEAAITASTACIVPVHLWGQAVDLYSIGRLAERHGIPLVEDCAQAHGTHYRGRHVGTFGRVGCFSFYPTKNIGAVGDAGAIVTDDEQLGARIRSLRAYGYDEASLAQREGLNGRIAELQAAVLRVKLEAFPGWHGRRQRNARAYREKLSTDAVRQIDIIPGVEPGYHQFVVRCSSRDRVTEALRQQQIEYGIHYPVPVHLMPAYEFLGGAALGLPNTVRACTEILSLPVHEGLQEAEVGRVIETLNRLD